MRALDRVIAIAIVGFVLAVPGSARASEDAGVASPVDHGTRAAARKPAPAPLLAADAPALRIALPAAAPVAIREAQAKRAAANAAGPAGVNRTPRVIGFGRELPVEAQVLPLEALPWIATADGGRAARIEIASPGAVAIRLGLRLNQSHPNLALRFRGSGVGAETFGPVPAGAIAGATSSHGIYWSPVLVGEEATLELHAAPGADVAATVLRLTKLSHLVADGIPRRNSSAKEIGQAGACEVDVACQPSTPALTDIANAVGRIVFSSEDGITMVCTGTLLRDAIASRTPYFLTANHCVDSAHAAATINVYWFYRAQGCGARDEPPYVLQTEGATLLARSHDWDWSLVRLHEPPPAGAHFAAWRAERIPVSASVITVHHPEGDLAKTSLGKTTGYRTFNDGSSFVMVYWSQGATEPSSSGAGLFTASAAGDAYELRGALWAGDSNCRNPGAVDYFSRLDIMLPLVKQYLKPDAVDASGRVVAVEFYNARLDHYFITTNADEVNRLDTGQTAGWVRTGFRFLAYDRPTAGANPVCRFYLRPEVGDSHFYSADPAECAATAQRFGADWIEESASVFYIPLPDTRTGACPAGTRPLWRFYHADAVNHRYTAEVAVRNELRRARGWVAEGYGPDGVIMCSPDGS